ncbi:MAG: hypothetical protein JNK60_21635 [Acidobacteria bacterium]|nr:hypothetical protein [Acidobacteriota bacterium]
MALRGPAGADILPLSEVRRGQKGYGLSVVTGHAIERFEVEVVDLLPNAAPGRAYVLVRVAGLGLEKSGVVAGMSGSPVYIDGRLMGALSATWSFSKEPLGLVTPIEAMLAMTTEPGSGRTPPVRTTTTGGIDGDLLRSLVLPVEERVDAFRASLEARQPRPSSQGEGLLAPVSSGFPASSFSSYEWLLRPLGGFARLASSGAGIAGVGGGGPASVARGKSLPLEPGSSMIALLVDGDFTFGATGTVTWVGKDGAFLAFGHPFLGWGDLELPVATAHVASVMPSTFQSFKLSWAHEPAYRLSRDRDPGIFGFTDRTAPMVPLAFRFEDSTGRVSTRSLRLAPSGKILPILITLVGEAGLTVLDPAPREKTLRFRIVLDGPDGSFVYQDVATGPRAKELALLTASTLAALVVDSDLAEAKITGISMSFVSEPGEKRARIVDAALRSRTVAPGEDVVATVRLRDFRGGESARVVRLTVPPETPDGKLTLFVGDGGTFSSLRMSLDPAEPRTLPELSRWLSRLTPSSTLGAALLSGGRGAATGSGTLSALPPSMAALLAGSGERLDVSQRILAESGTDLGLPLAGAIRLDFDVEKPRH